MDLTTLRTAGLSGRKAEYGEYPNLTYALIPLIQTAVQDLATRFADGRLTNDKILNAGDEELYELLIAVRGIGKVWTLHSSKLRSSE